MTIEVTQKQVYGNTLTYVTDESIRNSIKKLTGRKTLTDYDIEALKELGFVLVLKEMTVTTTKVSVL
tara:strand:- start:1641 stop:1841 length:201 start_codon:yes stop_codon:yes gene_type:complete